MNASVETIVIEAARVTVPSLVDAAHVYRATSDLFHATKVKDPIAAPDLAPLADETARTDPDVVDNRGFGTYRFPYYLRLPKRRLEGRRKNHG